MASQPASQPSEDLEIESPHIRPKEEFTHLNFGANTGQNIQRLINTHIHTYHGGSATLKINVALRDRERLFISFRP